MIHTRTTPTARLLSLVVAAAGVVGLLSAVTPPWSGRLTVVQDLFTPEGTSAADGLVVVFSLGTILLARGLARRRHRSWQAAVVLLGLSAVLHMVKGVDVEEAVFNLSVLGLLVWRRREFDASGDPAGPLRARRLAAAGLLALYGYGVVAIAANALLRHESSGGLEAMIRQITYGLAGQDVTAHPRAFAHGLTLSLAAAALALGVYIAWLALRPRDEALGQCSRDRADARRMVAAAGGDSLAYFALRRDKSYFFDAERRAFLAYRAVGGVALVSGDPIGDPDAFEPLVRAFARHCHGHAWRVAAMGVGRAHRGLWQDAGLRTLYVGDEAIVRPQSFSLEGRPIRKVRQSVTRLQKAGFRCEIVRVGELSPGRWRQVDVVSRDWLRGQPERGFSMALDDMRDPDHADTLIALGIDADDRVAGFVHFVPVPATNGLSLSAMRRRDGAPNGLTEFVLCSTFAWARERHVSGVSLNFNAFGELLRAQGGLCPWQRLLRFALGKADRVFQVERLLDFNRKFFPDWEPRYAAFERYADVPLGALVTLSVESLVIWPTPLRRIWPSAA